MSEFAKSRRRSAGIATRLLLPLLLATVAFLALTGDALGAEVRPYTGVSFGPDGAAGSQSFERVQGITVDASGNVYVYDGGGSKIYKFDSSGAPAEFSATSSNAISGVGSGFGGAEYELAVAPAGAPAGTAGDIYLANNSGEATVFSPAGAELGKLNGEGETCGVATDPSGNVFLGVFSTTIRKFVPTANPPKSTDAAGTGAGESVCNVAADGAGRVYFAKYNGGLYRLATLADKAPAEVDPTANTMAIQPGTNHVFANRGASFAEYEPDGTLVGVSGAGELSESHGIGVNAAATKVYAGTSTKVKVFGPSVLLPDVATEPVDGIAPKAATFHGSIGAAGGPPASCQFQYVTQEAFAATEWTGATSVPCDPTGPFTGTATEPVEAEVTALAAGTEYRVRLVGTNSNGANPSPSATFSTAQAVNVASEPATEVTGTSFRANGKVTPEGNAIEECVFEWGTGYEFQNSLPCAESSGEIGTGNAPVAVHANVTGLEPITQYQYRIRVENSIGTTKSSVTEVFTRGARIIGALEVETQDTSATFIGKVDPNNDPTTFVFEYVSKADFEASEFDNAEEAPPGGDSAGSGEGEVAVEAEATDLQPNTVYVVRLSVSNPAQDAVSGAIEFRTFSTSSPGVPDGRAYEQVTPVSAREKNGTDLLGNELNILNTSPSGNKTTYYSVAGAGDTDNGIQYPVYVAHRGGESWASTAVNIPARAGNFIRTLAWTETLSGAYVASNGGEGPATLYLKEFPSGNLITITDELENTTAGPRQIATSPLNTAIAAESKNGAVVLFESEATLAPGAADIRHRGNVYAWTKATGDIELVSVLPDGTAAPGAAAGPWGYEHGANYVEGTEHFEFQGANAKYYTQNTINQDGTKAFFSTTTDTQQIFMRADLGGSNGVTTEISASQKTNGAGPGGTDPRGPFPADYLGATPSGSYVFFKSHEELTNDAHTGPFPSEEFDLYRYDTATGELEDLTPTAEGAENAQVRGLAGFSDDGTYAYVVAGGALLPGAAPEGWNLYVWHEGDPLQLVAPLNSGYPDAEIWLPTRQPGGSIVGAKTASVTADGRTLTFQSAHQFDGFPNPTSRSEIYRWEFGGSGLQCISCNPTGGSTLRDGFLQHGEGAFVQPDVLKPVLPTNLSANGKRVFFATAEHLVARDTNGVEDVYEWEADGEGSCHGNSDNGGCLYLISSGTSPERSYFSGASANGDDVFFFTGQQLVGQDKDQYFDVYDARVGGGIASQNPTPVQPCEGEACLGGSVAPAPSQPRGTSTFSGPGNEKPKANKHKKKKHKKKRKHHGKRKGNGGHHKKAGQPTGENR